MNYWSEERKWKEKGRKELASNRAEQRQIKKDEEKPN